MRLCVRGIERRDGELTGVGRRFRALGHVGVQGQARQRCARADGGQEGLDVLEAEDRGVGRFFSRSKWNEVRSDFPTVESPSAKEKLPVPLEVRPPLPSSALLPK